MPPSIRAITFDVWETLIHDPVGSEQKRVILRAEKMSAILNGAGFDVSSPALVDAYANALPRLEAIWSDARDFDTAEQVGYVLSGLGERRLPPLDPQLIDELARAYAAVAFDYPPEIWPDTRATLAEVARRGYRIGLVCNTGRTPGWVLRDIFAKWEILDHFEALAFSNEVGVRKPNPSIFRGVLDRLGVLPGEALHVGDDVTTDIAGAKALGMSAAMVGNDGRSGPYQPDARLSRLGELIPLLDRWS